MEMEGGNLLSTWDYIIFALFLLVSISIGIYYRFSGGRQKTVEVCLTQFGFNIFI